MRLGSLEAALSVIRPALDTDDAAVLRNEDANETMAGHVVDALFAPWTPVLSVYSVVNNRWFNVRYVPTGMESYPGDRYADASRVEFYDATYADDGRFYRGLGQFTGGRFYTSSLLDDWGGITMPGARLALNGDCFEWTVDVPAMRLVVMWLKTIEAAGPLPKRIRESR